MKESAKDTEKARTNKNTKHSRKEGKMTSYFTTENHLLKTYETKDIFDAMEDELLRIERSDLMSEVEHEEEFLKKGTARWLCLKWRTTERILYRRVSFDYQI